LIPRPRTRAAGPVAEVVRLRIRPQPASTPPACRSCRCRRLFRLCVEHGSRRLPMTTVHSRRVMVFERRSGMAKAHVGAGLVAGCLLLWNSAAMAAAPTVAQMLSICKPRQEGVVCSTPTADQYEACTVELVNGGKRGSTGWLLRDPQKRPVRRFFDSNGDK